MREWECEGVRENGRREMLVRHFRDLRVYQGGFDAAMRVFELSKR